MTLEDLFRRLSYGELSNLAIGNDGAGEVQESARGKVVMHANEALLRLHSRFILDEQIVLLQTRAHQTSYDLHPRHAVSNKSPENKDIFLIDNIDRPMTREPVRVLEVSDNQGLELPLNETGNVNSIFTPSLTRVQIPEPFCGRVLSLTFQKYHEELTWDDESDLEQVIHIPEFLAGALRAMIGHLIYGAMNTQEAAATAQGHLFRYEKICVEAEEKDLVSASRSTIDTKFSKNGWV